jgi:hypothetical protein
MDMNLILICLSKPTPLPSLAATYFEKNFDKLIWLTKYKIYVTRDILLDSYLKEVSYGILFVAYM